jgi:transposase-like protein
MAQRRYSPKLKAQVVLEVLTGAKTPGQVARAYGVHPNSVQLWKRRFLERAPEIFSEEATVREYERRIRDLEQLIGKKEVEIALLKNFLGRSG